MSEASHPADRPRRIEAYEHLGIDDLIVGLIPLSTNSLDQLADADRIMRTLDSTSTPPATTSY